MNPGDRIAHLEVLERLDEGGMGAVFLARDDRLEREVALKVLHPGQVDGETRSRLLQEARILSQLRHPNICQIFELLEADPADPQAADCLVLELIRGRTLAQALEDGLTPGETLRIAREVAQTLVVAHARGVIHRDLKLANVMLSEEGEVKILDFGLARSPRPEDDRLGDLRRAVTSADPVVDSSAPTAPRAVDPTGYYRTEHGQVVGTASSMSPEQAQGGLITPATDVYSLGLMLQHLMTGQAPYESNLPHGVLLEKAADGDTRPVVGLDRDRTRLIESMKARAPEDRPTARQVAERLAWIEGRGRRRLRWLLASLLVAIAVLATAKHTLDLRRERNLALAAQRDAEQARQEAEEVSSFLVDLFEVSDPRTARGDTITARELLDRGAETIRRELTDQPATQAQLMDVIGRIDHRLGLYDEAEPLLVEALELRRQNLADDHPDLATSLHNLAALWRDRGRWDEAEPYFQEALAIREQALGPEHGDVAATLNELAVLYGMSGRLEQAEPLFRRALTLREGALGEDDPAVAPILNNLGIVHAQREEYAEAEPYFLRGLEIRQKTLPEDHPEIAANLVALGSLYANQGDHARGLPYYERGLEIWERALGPKHPRLGLTLTSLGSSYHEVGRDDDARAMLERALALREEVLGDDHPDVAKTLRTLAHLERDLGRVGVAETHLRRAIAIHEGSASPNPAHLQGTLEALAELLREAGRDSEAQAIAAKIEALASPDRRSSES